MNMIDKRDLIARCIENFPNKCKEVYRQIAEYAFDLGYKPSWIKVREKGVTVNSTALAFTKKLQNRSITILKISPKSSISLKFFATKEYSDIFKEGIKAVIEAFRGRYTGCYGCGKCSSELEGYTYVYPDGRKVFRCGGELITFTNPITEEHIDEVVRLIKTQDDYFEKSEIEL
jgi:hypothetical protein